MRMPTSSFSFFASLFKNIQHDFCSSASRWGFDDFRFDLKLLIQLSQFFLDDTSTEKCLILERHLLDIECNDLGQVLGDVDTAYQVVVEVVLQFEFLGICDLDVFLLQKNVVSL